MEKLAWLVPVLPAICWPGTYARVPVPPNPGSTSLRSIWLIVVATPAGIAFWVQLSPLTTGLPSSPFSGWPVRSSTAVTGVGSQRVPLAASVE